MRNAGRGASSIGQRAARLRKAACGSAVGSDRRRSKLPTRALNLYCRVTESSIDRFQEYPRKLISREKLSVIIGEKLGPATEEAVTAAALLRLSDEAQRRKMSTDIAKRQPLELDSHRRLRRHRRRQRRRPERRRISSQTACRSNSRRRRTGRTRTATSSPARSSFISTPFAPRSCGERMACRSASAFSVPASSTGTRTRSTRPIPKEEWLPGYEKGQLRGPVQNQNVLVFGDLATMEKFVWPSPTSTIGSSIAIRELNDKVKRMRRFRGGRVFAKVKLAQVPVSDALRGTAAATSGDRRLGRAHRARPRADRSALACQSAQQAPAPKMQPNDPAPGARVVTEPSLREELDDEVPFR